ncbi:MAG: triose-phosphate isomerase [Laribacter sp.]|nr:triose-phosphate isomerase [Laribacter sp.]MBP9528937.1 triose-phosphate isomerase [Laribacter sp.]MBP9608972.1 triose-phosphate isomerase [Laribacter sp.]
MAKRVIGNWKMFGRQARNAELVAALLADPACDAGHVSLGVPAAYLGQVASLLSGHRTGLAAQDVSRFSADGAYTGEISAAMLADCGCREVLLGHSERRQYFGEDDASLRLKVDAVYAAGLLPVVCVGESLSEREAGDHLAFVATQIEGIRDVLAGRTQVCIAYEPVWAIGTGRVAGLGQIAEMHDAVREKVFDCAGKSCNISVLYGGSVKADNVDEIMTLPQVDGALVGGASLDVAQFRKICETAAK